MVFHFGEDELATYWRLEKPVDVPTRLEWDKLAGRRSERYVCPANPAHTFSGKRLGDLHLLLPNAELQDFAWSWYSDCLIQDKVLRELNLQGFTGFEARAVHVRWEQASDRPLPKLWEIQVTGWGGIAPPESGITLVEKCEVCGRRVYTPFTDPKYLVDEQQWDGTDFFMVWPLSRFFVTDRVASFVRGKGFTGVEILALPEMCFPKHVKFLGPLPLRLQLPEDRAHKLGDSLGIY